MGWSLKIKETKKETKYRIWTSVSDGWVTKWATKEEIIKFLFWHRFQEFMDKFLKDAMTFPNQWVYKGEMRYIMGDKKEVEAYHDFSIGRFKVEGKDYGEVTADKFKEIITKFGIEVTVKDSDGYSFK